MRKTAIIILALAMVLTAGCQPTPEEEVVVEKNEVQIETMVELPIGINGVPKDHDSSANYYTGSAQSDDGYLTVTMDALLVIPPVDSYPVIAVEPLDISQEIADQILHALIGERTLYDISVLRTTDNLTAEKQALLQLIEDELSQYEESNPDYYQRKYNDIIKKVDHINRLLPDSTNERKAHSGQFACMEPNQRMLSEDFVQQSLEDSGYSDDDIAARLEEYRNQEFIWCYVEMGKTAPASIRISKYFPTQQQAVFFNTIDGAPTSNALFILDDNMVNQITITYKEALGMANNLIAQIGLDGMSLYASGAVPKNSRVNIPAGYLYKFIFTRSLNDMPVTYIRQTEHASFDPSIYPLPWYDEELEICVDENGVASFEWKNPIQLDEVINESVEILPFDVIKDIFFKEIVPINTYQEGSYIDHLTIDIDRITLGLVKVASKDAEGYMFVPAWDFFGKLSELSGDVFFTDGTYGQSFMTINAIDGSIIRREGAYRRGEQQ